MKPKSPNRHEGEDSADPLEWQGASVFCGFPLLRLAGLSWKRQRDQGTPWHSVACPKLLRCSPKLTAKLTKCSALQLWEVRLAPWSVCVLLLTRQAHQLPMQVGTDHNGDPVVKHIESLGGVSGHSRAINCVRFSPSGQFVLGRGLHIKTLLTARAARPSCLGPCRGVPGLSW